MNTTCKSLQPSGKAVPGGGFWTRANGEQRDDSRQGTTVVNLPE
jgi:hypothetical protein